MTDPFVEMGPGRKMTDSELASAIRQDIASELDAMSLYQAHIDTTDNEQAKAILAHIRDEEKEHAAEFLALLSVLDPKQSEEFREQKLGSGQPPVLTVGELTETHPKPLL